MLGLLSAVVWMTACTLPYYWQAVGGQFSLMRNRVPIETALGDAQLDATIREKLESVVQLREFAAAQLGLSSDGSYESFVQLDRDYVVWNVIAAERFSIDPLQWCFPVAGCVSYRGYFDRDAAVDYERGLAEDGFDTYSGGSGAYSTLGYFDDPVLSTMLTGAETDLAGILFHELAHQRVYIAGDSELSEGFASAVEAYGVERWLESQGDQDRLTDYQARLERSAEFAALVTRQREVLAEIYASGSTEPDLVAAKAAAFERMREDYAQLKNGWSGATDYDGWFNGPMNNARLAAIATYRKWLPGLRWRISAIGPESFYRQVEALAELESEERERTLIEWNRSSDAGSGA